MKKDQKKVSTSYPPEGILTPNEVMTSLGLLQFNDGVPTKDTSKKVYDYLDTMRGVDSFFKGMPAASLGALLSGMQSLGARLNHDVVYTKTYLDSKPMFLTGNTSTVYAFVGLDLVDGPVILDVPEGALGAINNAWFRYLEDVGPAGPDNGNGGKYIIVPPHYHKEISEEYYVVQSDSYKHWIFLRFPLKEGEILKDALKKVEQINVHPLDKTPETKFYNVSEQEVNTIHSNDFQFYHELNEVIQHEPLGVFDKETRGLFASIGIEKDKLFDPYPRMKAILKDAIAIGNAASRSIVWYPRVIGSVGHMNGIQVYPRTNSNWVLAFVDKNVFFDGKNRHTMNSDARVTFHYPYTAVTPAMAKYNEGQGSDYAMAFLDENNNLLDGSKKYTLRIPPNVPAADFWAVTIYDTQTRSQLQTLQNLPTLGSNDDLIQNDDKSYNIHFAPKQNDVSPELQKNRLFTLPDKSWFIILRLYGPLDEWNERTWQPGEIQLFEGNTVPFE